MKKIAAVEDARQVMKQGIEWGVWKWLTEKKRVRELADKARGALDDIEMKTKLTWSDDYKIVYNSLVNENGNPKRQRKAVKDQKNGKPAKGDAKVLAVVSRVKEADDQAYNAHEDAEEIFAEAERKMSTSMAREGAKKALEAYDLHEAAIRKAEEVASRCN